MAESGEAFILHPSILISALHPILPNSQSANRLLGEVTMGRRAAYAIGHPQLLELRTVDALIGSGLLDGLTNEDQANVLRDLRLQLRELNLAGSLHTEEHQRYLPAAMSLGARFRIDLYSAMTVALARIHGLPLILDDGSLYDRLQSAVVRPGLRVLRLSDYP